MMTIIEFAKEYRKLKCPNGHYAEMSLEGRPFCIDPECPCWGWNDDEYLTDWKPSWVSSEPEAEI